VAISRLFLDNIPHIRMLVNYIDRKLLQVLLEGGVDDVGGTSLDEQIAKAAGAPTSQRFGSTPEMDSFITDLGLTPRLVNSRYESTSHSRTSLAMNDVEPNIPAGPPPLLGMVLGKAERGERLSAAESVCLLNEAELGRLGSLAQRRRHRDVPGDLGTFIIDRNLSSTNVCEAGCKFCAFHVSPESGKGFCLSASEILHQVIESVDRGATQVLIQGGLNPALNLAFYEHLFAAIKQKVQVCIHSLSPTEIAYFARKSGITLQAAVERLHRAGLDSLPGGGAEILVDEVRQRISPKKIQTNEWLEVMETAQKLGMKTTATMVYGFGESNAQRVEHLLRIRALQDKTHGFTAFIPWSFQPNKTLLAQHPASGPDYLRMVAIARLVLDNIPHIQAGWVTEGPDLAQLALVFGADDFGGVLMDEQVVRATGTTYAVAPELVVDLIAQTGLIPAQRDTQYRILRRF
jgi:cyclic dehypoxanthinyl futalosine synthase